MYFREGIEPHVIAAIDAERSENLLDSKTGPDFDVIKLILEFSSLKTCDLTHQSLQM